MALVVETSHALPGRCDVCGATATNCRAELKAVASDTRYAQYEPSRIRYGCDDHPASEEPNDAAR